MLKARFKDLILSVLLDDDVLRKKTTARPFLV